MKIIIDASRGGIQDKGVEGFEIVEKDWTLLISEYLYQALNDLGIETLLTRYEDITLSETERIKIINDSKSMLCISNNLSFSSNYNDRGLKIIHSNNNGKDLSSLIYNNLVNSGLVPNSCSTKSNIYNDKVDYYDLQRLTPNCVTIKIYYSFINNKLDADNIKNNWQIYADSVVQSIVTYIGAINSLQSIMPRTFKLENLPSFYTIPNLDKPEQKKPTDNNTPEAVKPVEDQKPKEDFVYSDKEGNITLEKDRRVKIRERYKYTDQLVFKNNILDIVTKNSENDEKPLKIIRGVVIQSTGTDQDLADQFYETPESKQHAHYVVDQKNVVKYAKSFNSVFNPTDTKFTTKAIGLDPKKETNPSTYLTVFDVSKNSFEKSKEKLIDFLAEFLIASNVDETIVHRRKDIIDEKNIYNSPLDDDLIWKGFITDINTQIKILKEKMDKKDQETLFVPKAEEPNTIDAIFLSLMEDTRESTNNDGSLIDNFTNSSVANEHPGEALFEPIHPDLTTPPIGNANLYAEKLLKMSEFLDRKKKTLGSGVNSKDPYPVDQKIAELEIHRPKIRIEPNEIFTPMPGSCEERDSQLKDFMLSMSERVERRTVQLENIVSTLMRYQFRMASRINVNCVYYGGQANYDKFSNIRCLNDDLTQDGDVFQMDQCLNCSRYEPVIGQVYDILDDDLMVNLAPFLDDNQMSRIDMNDRLVQSNTEKMNNEQRKAEFEISNINGEPEDYEEFKKLWPEGEKMNWDDVNLEGQTPDINEYVYNPADIITRKDDILSNQYDNGYSKVKKVEVSIPADSYLSGGAPGGIGGAGSGGMFSTGAEIRSKIVEAAKVLLQRCKDGKGGYSIEPGKRGKEINGVLYLDCSAFANKCYTDAGLTSGAGGGNTAAMNSYFRTKGKVFKDVKQALPGDLILWNNHVGIYIGDNQIIHSSTSSPPMNKQWKQSNVYYDSGKNKFFGFCRTEELLKADEAASNYTFTGDLGGFNIASKVNGTLMNMKKFGYAEALKEVCAMKGFDPYLLLAMAAKESDGNAAIGATNGGRDRGMLQVAHSVSGAANVKQNMLDAINHFIEKQNALTRMAGVKVNNIPLVLWSYNQGQGRIKDVLKHAGVPLTKMNEVTPDQYRQYCLNSPYFGGNKKNTSYYALTILAMAEAMRSQKVLG